MTCLFKIAGKFTSIVKYMITKSWIELFCQLVCVHLAQCFYFIFGTDWSFASLTDLMQFLSEKTLYLWTILAIFTVHNRRSMGP